MDQPCFMDGGCLRGRFRAGGLHGCKSLAAAFEQNSDKIDHDRGIARRGHHRIRITQVGLHGMDLADAAERLKVPGQVGAAHRDADAITALRQRAHDIAAEKSGAADDGDQGIEAALGGHCSLPLFATDRQIGPRMYSAAGTASKRRR